MRRHEPLCYLTVIRPVLEYCSVGWHHGLTKAQSESLEAIQCRALRIIYPLTIVGMPYNLGLHLCTQSCQLPSLHDRREHTNRQFFRSKSSSCISSLLPIPRDHDVTSRLRAASVYSCLVTCTKRYISFINYLARSANLPTGLYILPSVISSFFTMSKAISVSTGPIFTIFSPIEDICVSFLNLVQLLRFLKGRCHGNQFCLVPDSFARIQSISGSAGPIFTIFAPYGRY